MMKKRHLYWAACLALLIAFSVPISAEELTDNAAAQSAETVPLKDAAHPKVGLVLGGGGARGFAHIGVIKVLEELGIPIDYVAGTSMGSIVGGLYASGYSAAELEQIISGIDWDFVLSDTPTRSTWSSRAKQEGSKYLFGLGFDRHGFKIAQGLTKGQKISTLFSFLTLPVSEIEGFDHLPIPYRAVAADIGTGDEVILDHGSLAEAMRASMSVPGVFTPVEIEGHLLVDGGIVNNVPVNVVKAMGADIIIAVDVSSKLVEKQELGNPFSVLNQMVGIQMLKATQAQLKMADVVLSPALKDYTAASFGNGKEITALGEEAARKQIDQLKALADDIHKTRAFGRSISQGVLKSLLNIDVEDVTVTGAGGTKAELSIKNIFSKNAFSFARKKEDVVLNPTLMAQVVEEILGTGYIESVVFSLLPGTAPEKKLLNLRIEEKTTNPNLLRFGMYYESRFHEEESDKLAFLTNLTFNDLTGRGSFWATDLQFVNVNKLETRYFQPIFKGLSIIPEVYTRSDYQVLYDDQESTGRYNIDSNGFSVSLGGFLPRIGFVSAGYRFENVDASLKANIAGDAATAFDFDDEVSSLRFKIRLDLQDAYPFPHSGGLFDLEYDWASRELGGTIDFSKLLLNIERYVPLGKKHTVGFRFQGGTNFDTDMPAHAHFLLGGRDSFVGYKAEEIRGKNLGILALEYRYQLLKMPAPIGGNVFLTLIGNAGDVWEKTSEVTEDFSPRYGGSAGLGVDTFLGPITADFSMGDEGRYIFYLSIGKKF